ncbi:MAG: hypothetical protein ABSG53_03435 [Thermoguttaceae bacterium]
MRVLTAIPFIVAALLASLSARADEKSVPEKPLAEKYLLEGQLTEGATALTKRLQDHPLDDQARFGLGVTQFLQTFEHLGQSLYRYGLRTERFFIQPVPQIRELLPQNPHPEKIDYAAARKIVQTFVDDLNRAEATLAEVKDEDVKLRLHMALIKIDLFGLKRPINGATLFRQFGPQKDITLEQLQEFYIAFDRGDVCWLRGYCHFLAAWGEVLLSVDSRSLFECSAHWAFEDVDTPHTFLIEDRKPLDAAQFGWWWSDSKRLSDAIAAFHLVLRLPMKEPERMKVAHGHLLAMCKMSKEMWTHYEAETDDDHEWIPNPRQTGVVGMHVTKEMFHSWLETVDEAEQVLQGKRLIPFWRGNQPDRGVNLKRVFCEPTDIDIPLWIQGTGATPYLEKGPLTKLADREVWRQMDETFGGLNFVGFGFWFN